jgi:hypothetical protein
MSFWRAVKQAIVDSISINPSNEYADEAEVLVQTQVTSSGAWSHRASDVPSWITVNNGSGTTGQYFQCTLSFNSGTFRVATISIWLTANNSVYQDFNIEQTGSI